MPFIKLVLKMSEILIAKMFFPSLNFLSIILCQTQDFAMGFNEEIIAFTSFFNEKIIALTARCRQNKIQKLVCFMKSEVQVSYIGT